MTAVRRTALAALLAAPVLGLAGLPAWADDAAVQTTGGNTFSPASVTVDVGDTVTWTNNGGLNHTVTASTNNWAKNNSIGFSGQSTAYTFESPGTYGYYCQTHGGPGSGMSGTVVVRGAASPTPPASPSAKPTPKPTPKPSVSPSVAPSPTPTRTPSRTPSATAKPSPSRSAPLTPQTQLPTRHVEPAVTPAPLELGFGGLKGAEPTHRERGLPIALAVIALLGVGTAEVRVLLSVPTAKD